MPKSQKTLIPTGWKGGFAASRPEFRASTPELGKLDMLKNMDNIHLLQRQQAILWPEFSWETAPGKRDPKRCFQMFAPDISRVGYTNEGRVYSIICPQQGIETPSLGSINVEVTVTGQRGWVDEDTRELACDMTVQGRVWFGPGHEDKPAVKLLWKLLDEFGHDLPITKDKAIVISTHKPGDPGQPIFRLATGESTRFDGPEFARHASEAWAVGHIEVQMGEIEPTHIGVVDDFNRLVLEVLNLSSGNMLLHGNVLTWNVWFNQPEIVNQEQWRDHAEKWRTSIDIDHFSPERGRSPARFADDTLFVPEAERLELEAAKIYAFMSKHLSPKQQIVRTATSVIGSLRSFARSLGGVFGK